MLGASRSRDLLGDRRHLGASDERWPALVASSLIFPPLTEEDGRPNVDRGLRARGAPDAELAAVGVVGDETRRSRPSSASIVKWCVLPTPEEP